MRHENENHWPRSDCPTYSLGRGCEDHDFQRIPHLPGNQHGVYLRSKPPPPSPAKARIGGGGCGAFKWLVHKWQIKIKTIELYLYTDFTCIIVYLIFWLSAFHQTKLIGQQQNKARKSSLSTQYVHITTPDHEYQTVNPFSMKDDRMKKG